MRLEWALSAQSGRIFYVLIFGIRYILFLKTPILKKKTDKKPAVQNGHFYSGHLLCGEE